MIRPVRSFLLTVLVVPFVMANGPFPQPFFPRGFDAVAGSCAHAAAVAQQRGGEVIGAPQLVTQGGRQVCVVTVLIHRPGGPPVRQRITVPAR